MAKSSRASTTKANNQRLKAKVFGPVESARQERLSAKLLELASQPKPVPEKEMKDAEEQGETEDKTQQESKADDSKCLTPGIILLGGKAAQPNLRTPSWTSFPKQAAD